MAELVLNVKIGGVEKSVTTVNELESALRATREELKNVQIGSQAFEDLSEQAQTLQREFVNSFKETTNFNKGIAELGQSVGSLASSVTAGFTIVTSAFQIFGDESQELSEAQVKAQQSLAIAISATTLATNAKTLAEDLGNVASALGISLTRQKTATTVADTAATTADTVAKGAQATATGGAAVAQEALNVAMAANPLGLLLVGLTALIGALVLFSDEQESAKTNIDETTESILLQIDAQQKQTDDFTKLFQQRRKIYEAEATTQEERLKREQETAKLLGQVQDSSNERQKKSIENLQKENLKAFEQYSVDLIGERQVLVREVSQYDEFGIFIGKAQEYATETFTVNAAVIADIKAASKERLAEITKRGEQEKKQLDADLKAGTISEKAYQEQIKLINQQGQSDKQTITFDSQIQILDAQKRFLAQSDKADDENFAEGLQKTIQSLTSLRQQYSSFYNDLIAQQLQAIAKQQEEDEKEKERQAEEAKRRAEKAKQDRKAQLEENAKFLEDQRKAQADSQRELDEFLLQRGALSNERRKALGIENLGIQESLLKIEQDAQVAAIREALAERNKEVQATKALSEAKRNQLVADNNKAAEAEIATLNALFVERRKVAAQEDKLTTDEALARSEKLKQINEILQSEIRFGDQDTFDNLLALNIRQQELAAQSLEADLNREDIRLNDFIDKTRQQQALLVAANEAREKLQIEAVQREATRNLQNFAAQLEQEFNLQSDFDTKVLNSVLALNESELRAEKELLLSKKETLTDEERARLALIQSRINGEEEASIRIQEITQQSADARVAIEEEADDKILRKRLDTFNQILNNVRSSIDVLRSDVTQPYFTVLDTLQQGLNSFIELQDQEFATVTEKVLAYTGAALQAVQGLLQAVSQANQAALQQDLEAYRLAKQEETNILTEQYNKGLISKEQFDAGIKAADDKFRKKELDAKKKAFEEDKKLKIAQAIIAGLQGAISAFAGAMSLGPIAGPIVGGVLAALVATLTGVQVAAIAATKFDSGPTQVNPPTTTGPDPGAALQQQAGSTGGFTQFNQALTGEQTGGGTPGATTGGMTDTRVYVLESDITATQRRVSIAESTATFG